MISSAFYSDKMKKKIELTVTPTKFILILDYSKSERASEYMNAESKIARERFAKKTQRGPRTYRKSVKLRRSYLNQKKRKTTKLKPNPKNRDECPIIFISLLYSTETDEFQSIFNS